MMFRRKSKGFTLIEMVIVFTLIGILVGLALPQYQNAMKKARESVLKETLFVLRKLIDQYYTDKSKYPDSLQALVDEKYLRKIPADPITGKSDAWIEVKEQPTVDELEPGQAFGVVDVHSSSEDKSLDGTPYNTW
ncbi:MAG: type II secretion system protein [Candidatus Aminicenantes bacterium]|nr:type II secretion system protein [Candidatus Aminicenantes bacterium]